MTFMNRASAEFAKIAMADQSLGNGDVINVRWATDDPNPKTIELKKRKTEERVLAALKAQGYGTTEEQFEYPVDYQVPKRAKTEDSTTGADDEQSAPAASSVDDGKIAYPDTDAQFEPPAADKIVDKDAFSEAREEEEESGGGANWLRDAAWAAVRENEDVAASQQSAAEVAHAQQWQQYYAQNPGLAQQWQQYYAQDPGVAQQGANAVANSLR